MGELLELRDRYQPAQNQVLLHFQFHQIKQEPGEKIDSFINEIRQHADKCAFKCTNPGCTEKDQVHNTLIRDQIVIGTNIASISENALEKEHDLASLISTARKIEATEEATKVIDLDSSSNSLHLNYVQHENPHSLPLNKIGKKGANTPKKHKEGRMPKMISHLSMALTKLCAVLVVVEIIVTEAQTAQLKMPFAMHVEKRVTFQLSA